MKRIISFFFFLNLIITVYAQNPVKKALYTCAPNEEFYQYEFTSNMKVQGTKYACMVKNTNNNKLSLVINGVRIITADDVWVYWIDLNSPFKSIYYYRDGEDRYLSINGTKYGPYEQIAYNLDSAKNTWDGRPNYKLMYNKDLFWFKRMGKWYRHDKDGAVYECLDGREEIDPVYKDVNGQNKLEFTENFRLIKFNGTSFILPIDLDVENKKIDLDEICITPEGTCIATMSFLRNNWIYLRFIIRNNELVFLSENEYYDPETGNVNTIPKNKDNTPQFESVQRYVADRGGWINAFSKSFQDKYNKHLFTSSFEYDYVMIDDKKIKSEVPIEAFYDESDNSFDWVTIAGKSLVLYNYKL